MDLKIKIVDDYLKENNWVPKHQTKGSAGLDLVSVEEVVLAPGETKKIRCGFKVEIPFGCVGLVCPRSGLAAEHNVTVLNAPGIIDYDWRGENCVILTNHGQNPFEVKKGFRIAQMLIMSFYVCDIRIVEDLTPTSRGEGGFGSTGLTSF